MKLSQCTIGALVIERIIPGGAWPLSRKPQIGHVVGLEVTSAGETIPVVQFAQPFRHFSEPATRNEPRGIHHGNLEPYTD